jgi:S1-C subfamily serine protease
VSTDEALAFRFETPSHSQADNAAERGTIRVDVYLPQPGANGARGTGAGSVIDQPTLLVPFSSVTQHPVDVFDVNYARTSVSLGILCGETGGVGVRITQVVEGTIAELRGLKAGDVITHINAIAVNTCAELSAVLATKAPGDRVVLKVHREDRDFLLTLEIEE